MAGRQRTFELVPNAPAGFNGPRSLAQSLNAQAKPPMTTKQAQKLHRKAGKGPKLSKAEQRRIELMEQDRIRKEFEKEKAQARARTAREKRRLKEEQEKEARRKKGMPLVDVHPSQDTLARFLKVGKVRQVSPVDECVEHLQHRGSTAKPLPHEFLRDEEARAPDSPVNGSPRQAGSMAALPQPQVATVDNLDFPLIATQDFFLSSQDYREIAGYSNKHHNPLSKAVTTKSVRHESSLAVNSPAQPLVPSYTARHTAFSDKPLPDTLSPHDLHGSDSRDDDTESPAEPPIASPDMNDWLHQHGKLAQPQPMCRSSNQKHLSQSVCAVAPLLEDTQPLSGTQHSHSSQATPCQSSERPVVEIKKVNSPSQLPPKKRMFGSSGPGAEILVAMERSYQQDLRDRRNRNTRLGSQHGQLECLQHHTLDSAVNAVDVNTRNESGHQKLQSSPRQSFANTQPGLRPQVQNRPDKVHSSPHSAAARVESLEARDLICQPSSQETDYGDIDFASAEELLALVECNAG
ncbi:hypothetical protein BD289DRAFT_455321 [Coniella lustricola]|uniref:Uncharacterized protein n=1 Tax=Coniella lustricola TaxID=2025994 RepID=A0A2T3A082_9PEZI|nr:hypothetical protein BD289DRAFT_455321 [Coniella lustricola]